MLRTCIVAAAGLIVSLLVAARGDQVELVTGEVLQGQVVGRSEEGVVLLHPILGRLVIPAGTVKRLIMTDAPLGPPAAPPVAAPAPATQPAAASAPAVSQTEPGLTGTASAKTTEPTLTPPTIADSEVGRALAAANAASKVWKRELTLSIAMGQDANESVAGSVGVTAKKETIDDRLTLDASFYYEETNSQATRNEFTSGVLQDWLIRDSKWFYFAEGRFDYAEFRPYRERLTAVTGPGYQLIKNEKLDVLLRMGLGGYQNWGPTDNRFHPEASLGTEVAWLISKQQKIVASETFYADLETLGQSRNIASADWIIKLDKLSGLSLKFSVQDEYDSAINNNDNAEQISHNDLKLLGGLQLDF